MPQILQLTQFIQHHGVTEVNIRCGRIQTEFDTQRHTRGRAAGEFLHPFGLHQQFIAAAFGHGQCVFHRIGDRVLGRRVICRRRRLLSHLKPIHD